MGLSNYVPNSRIAQPGVCTSVTRPASPFEGQVIYETDTNRVLVYDASAWVMIADTDEPPGMQLVKTQSITNGSSTVVVENVFTTQYDNYRVVGSMTTGTGGGINIRFRTGAGDDQTANYRWGRGFFRFDDVVKGSYGEVTGTSATVFMTKTVRQAIAFDVFAPNLASQTTYNSMPYVEGDTGVASSWIGFAAGMINTTTQYTGFTLVHSTGTFTGGSLSVYGYRN